jgi:hypothetical protein
MGTVIPSEPEQIFQEDTQAGAAVSESILAKYGATNNYFLDYFERYSFGVTGGVFSQLVTPYTFSQTADVVRASCAITLLEVYLGETGTSGTTQFRIERQLAAGGAWSNLFSTNCSITSSAADGVTFNTNSSGITGVTVPVFTITSLAAGDKIRLVLVTSATSAQNLTMTLYCRPT